MHTSLPIVPYLRSVGLKEIPCASCNEYDNKTRCYYNAHFTNCPWTGRALQWARELESTYITVDIETVNQTGVSE